MKHLARILTAILLTALLLTSFTFPAFAEWFTDSKKAAVTAAYAVMTAAA